jgi:hypothetical protein
MRPQSAWASPCGVVHREHEVHVRKKNLAREAKGAALPKRQALF